MGKRHGHARKEETVVYTWAGRTWLGRKMGGGRGYALILHGAVMIQVPSGRVRSLASGIRADIKPEEDKKV